MQNRLPSADHFFWLAKNVPTKCCRVKTPNFELQETHSGKWVCMTEEKKRESASPLLNVDINIQDMLNPNDTCIEKDLDC